MIETDEITEDERQRAERLLEILEAKDNVTNAIMTILLANTGDGRSGASEEGAEEMAVILAFVLSWAKNVPRVDLKLILELEKMMSRSCDASYANVVSRAVASGNMPRA